MKILQNYRLQRGIGLLELMLALAVIVSIILLATRYYQITREGAKVREASQMLQAIYIAGGHWVVQAPLPEHNMINDFVTLGYLPQRFVTPTVEQANPWGGAISAQRVVEVPHFLVVTFTQVPMSACRQLAAELTQVEHAASCLNQDNASILKVSFNYGQ